METKIQNPVIIRVIRGAESEPIRKIANEVFIKLKEENHPLAKHYWGDNLSYNKNIELKTIRKWYPIEITQGIFTSPELFGFRFSFEIARRGKQGKRSGLILNIRFGQGKKKGRHYYDKFIDKYFDNEKKRKNYKLDSWDRFPRISLQIKNEISYDKIAEDEVDLVYENLKSFYNDWHENIEEFLNENFIKELTELRTLENTGIINKQKSKFTELKISNLKISNFINFAKTEEEFSSGINLFIGNNNIGKTTLLKFLYAQIKAVQGFNLESRMYPLNFREQLRLKLLKVFPENKGIGTIVNYKTEEALISETEINFDKTAEKIKFSFKSSAKTDFNEFNTKETDIFENKEVNLPSVVFIPSKEILSLHKVLQETRKRVTGFDDTFYDLHDSIRRADLIDNNFENISNKISKIIEGKIEYDDNQKDFIYINNDGQEFNMSMTAEGVKQLGMLYVLIKNGEIHENSVLFLDEPDNNLNPTAIKKLVNILIELANAGVQIFIATHNHLLSELISLYGEYKNTLVKQKKQIPDMKFFALHKNEQDETEIETENTLTGITNNLILDEFANLHDTELEFSILSQK